MSEFARRKLAFEPDARQAAVLDSMAKRGILNCTRQWGKSTVLAVKAVHRAWTVAGSLTLVASPSERQSGEFLRKAAEFLGRLGVKRRGDGDNSSSLALPNGSRIVGLPGIEGTVRGFSAVSLLLIDEASRVSDATYKSLRPMLAVGNGDLWLMSTPYGKRGFFYDAWAHGDGWERHAAPATGCPRIPAEFLEEERRANCSLNNIFMIFCSWALSLRKEVSCAYHAVESTTLATVAYDEALELLQLEFRSRAIYQYFGVPVAVHEALLGCAVQGPLL